MGSTRLPGKVLADVSGRPMLDRVVRRTAQADLVDRVVVATTDHPGDDLIVQRCDRLALDHFRGSEEDVLDRYHRAAAMFSADAVVRITADCPLVDPSVIDRVVRAFLDERPDYAANTLRRTYPRGLDTEVIAAEALDRAWREAGKPYHRAHVCPYIYEHPERFRLLSVSAREDYSDGRWTVDTPEDLEFVRRVYRQFGSDDAFAWRDVLDWLAGEPSVAALNRHVCQKEVEEG